MKQTLILCMGLCVLGACTQQVPDSGAGVGFSDYSEYEIERAQREADLRGESFTPPAQVSEAPLDTPPATASVAANSAISDEQDFDAVASRESIESDAARLQRQAEAYQVIEPTALPERQGSTGPNIVQYALNAPNSRGEAIYNRSGLSGLARFSRNCAKYNNPDDAQRDFLSRGGPARDRLGIDPDGDGFACGWDPTPFRQLATAAASN